MTGVKSLVFLMSLMWAAVRSQQSDVTVSSGFMSDQILPCTFLRSDYLTVHWYKGRKDIGVHSYYDGKDQLAFQDPKFKGRTSLSHDQLTRGNASLLLKKVQVSDGGSYGCYTSNKVNNNIEPQESFINLEVFAPVAEISIVQEGCHVTCRSVGIYPEPRVTWSRNKMADTRIEKTEQQLYNISSSVRVDGDGDYSCNVSSVRSSWRATLTTASSVLSRTDDTLDCPALKSPLTSVTWRFNDTIIVQREDHLNITESWRDHVKDLSSSGSLTLQNLSPDLTGIYTCEVTNHEETHVEIIYVMIAGKC